MSWIPQGILRIRCLGISHLVLNLRKVDMSSLVQKESFRLDSCHLKNKEELFFIFKMKYYLSCV